MRAARLLLPSSLVLVACAGSTTRYRHELVGHGNGVVSSRAAGAGDVTAASGLALSQGNYDLAMRFEIPRAQVIDWKIVCPGVEVAGQIGETFEEYRARRIAELQRERERERQRIATATSIVVGAVAPRVQGRAKLGNADVHAEAHVDAHAAGVAAAHGTVPDGPLELAPGDVGRGTLAANARVMTAGDGVCALHVLASDADVRAMFSVTRIRDLDAEQRMRLVAARDVAVKTRGTLRAQLVARGADPTVREQRLAAETARARAEAARRQAEADARARAEAALRVQADVALRAKAELRARHEALAIHARERYVAYLTGKCNADPHRRDRIANEERRRREARLVADAELAQRRDLAALSVRDRLRAQLVAYGAKARPPMPAPLAESPGAPPFTGAAWVAGRWTWTGTTWHWHAGGWTDPHEFGDAGRDVAVEVGGDMAVGGDVDIPIGVDVGVGVGVGIDASGGARPPRTYQTGTRDHRDGTRVRDHRDDTRVRDHRDGTRVRDHRDDTRVRDHREDTRVRDHRDGTRAAPTARPAPSPPRDPAPRVRDHRDHDKDDDAPRVRDRRR